MADGSCLMPLLDNRWPVFLAVIVAESGLSLKARDGVSFDRMGKVMVLVWMISRYPITLYLAAIFVGVISINF